MRVHALPCQLLTPNLLILFILFILLILPSLQQPGHLAGSKLPSSFLYNIFNFCTGFTGDDANARQSLLPEVIAVADSACFDSPHGAAKLASAGNFAGIVAILDFRDIFLAVVVMPHDAANVAAAADSAGVVAVLNNAVWAALRANILSCDAACGTIGTDSAGVVAPRNSAVVIPHDAASYAVSFLIYTDIAAVAAVADRAAAVGTPHNTANEALTSYGDLAGVFTVLDSDCDSTIGIPSQPNDAANIGIDTAGDVDTAGVAAVLDGTAFARPHNAANIGIDAAGDIHAAGTAADCAAVVYSHDAANRGAFKSSGVDFPFHSQVLYRAVLTHRCEQACASVCSANAAGV